MTRYWISAVVYLALVGAGTVYLYRADKASSYCETSWWRVDYLARRDLAANHRLSSWDLRQPEQRGMPEAPVTDKRYLGKYLVKDVKAECPVDERLLSNTPALAVAAGKAIWPYTLAKQGYLADVLQPGDKVTIHGKQDQTSPCIKDMIVVAVVKQDEQDVALLEAPFDAKLLDTNFLTNSVLIIDNEPTEP